MTIITPPPVAELSEEMQRWLRGLLGTGATVGTPPGQCFRFHRRQNPARTMFALERRGLVEVFWADRLCWARLTTAGQIRAQEIAEVHPIGEPW